MLIANIKGTNRHFRVKDYQIRGVADHEMLYNSDIIRHVFTGDSYGFDVMLFYDEFPYEETFHVNKLIYSDNFVPRNKHNYHTRYLELYLNDYE